MIASDCVFLVEMLETLLETAAVIFKKSSPTNDDKAIEPKPIKLLLRKVRLLKLEK